METIIKQSPWIVNGKPLMVQKWSPDVYVEKAEPSKVPIWIKIFSIPLEAWSVKGISTSSSMLEKPLVMDNMTASMCHKGTVRAAYARVMVEIDAKKGFKDSIEIQYNDKNDCVIRTKFVKVEYSWKPAICCLCCVFGHNNFSYQKHRVNKVQQDNKKVQQKNHNNKGFMEVRGRKNGLNGNGLHKRKDQNNNNGSKAAKGKWKEMQRKKCVIETDSDEDIECEENEAARKLVADDIDRVDSGVLMGDFNVTLKTNEHSSGSSIMSGDMVEFNDCVNNLELEDICSTRFQFTWTKSLKNHKSSIMKKLDIIIINEGFLQRFMNYIADKKDFIECVEREWESEVIGCNMYKVVQKLKRLKKPLNRLNWRNGNLTEKVAYLKKNLKDIQAEVEKNPFNCDLKARAVKVLNEYMEVSNDELKLLQQKAKIKCLSEGDQNTTYFYEILKSRKHKGRIKSICNENGNRYDGDKVAKAFFEHFKKFLGTKQVVQPLSSVDINLEKTLSEDEAKDMISMVTNDEIKEAIFDIDSNKASGPDGYTSRFFKKAWSIIGKEVYLAIRGFFINGKLLGEINATMIALIPKLEVPNKVSEFRPISCCNVIYKSISKILTNRIKNGLQKVVNLNQSAFIPGRHTQDNILIAQELLKGYKRKNGARRCALKIDIQKAYDTVNWEFLKERLMVIFKEAGVLDKETLSLLIYSLLLWKSSHYCLPKISKMQKNVVSVGIIKKSMEQFSNNSGLFPNMVGILPMRYLGVPLIAKKLSVNDCKSLVDKVAEKINC
ncbi:RNA-directed DNA polymerase, eukaryota, reverse transcriptase zinc-binding domain protein [Tanacetum coccineum]